jgi:formylglycine-generating enzyme required for sulfatase activity
MALAASAVAGPLEQSGPIKPGEVFQDCPDCPVMVVVPAGTFLMGAPTSEAAHEANESPRHTVTIARQFAVGRFEVTRAEYQSFIRATGNAVGTRCVTREGNDTRERADRNFLRPGIDQTDRDPVVCISWHDARDYARWLSRRTGFRYRLLTEAEWEYAARAGSESAFPWGDSIDTSLANYDGQYTYNGGTPGERRLKTMPVGSFAPNAFSLFDMTGNVWEWVLDCRHSSYEGAPNDGSAWFDDGTSDCRQRIRRGGSWDGYAKSVRSANRYWNYADFRSNYDGFRVARDLP